MKKRTIIVTRKQINISKFSTFSYLQTDKSKISEQIEELRDEKEALESDLAAVKDAVQAASKISGGETPSREENECLLELKDNYPTFFDSEGEEEGISLLNKIMSVKRYLQKEIKSNKRAMFKLSKKDSDKSVGESSNPSLVVEEKGESSKRKLEHSDSEESSSSKKSRSSVSEFLDDLPYNPFDDTGTD